MAYRITYTERFKKHFKRLSDREKRQVKKKLELLAENPFHPSLRTKKIRSDDYVFECSVNMDIRVTWFYENDSIIIIVDIGHHDIIGKH